MRAVPSVTCGGNNDRRVTLIPTGRSAGSREAAAAHPVGLLLEAEVAGQGADHVQVHPARRGRRGTSPTPARLLEVAAQRPDRVSRQIRRGGRPVELVAQPVAEAAVDRRVLLPRAGDAARAASRSPAT